jgi:hypothetical protein
MADNATSRESGPFTIPMLGYELWGPALAGVAKWNGTMYEGFATLGSEWLDFVNRRLKEDLRLPQHVCACRSPDEVRETYAAFWRQAVDDYQKELVVLAGLGNGLLRNSLPPGRAEETARDTRQPLAAAA